MKTKDLILAAALKLFNSSGTAAVTTRHIAKEMGISHGNLCYHYPKKEVIIKNLYEALVEELSTSISKMETLQVSLQMIFSQTKSTFSIQLKYKFFLIELVNIMREIPEIHIHFQKLFETRAQQFLFITNRLIEADMFKKEIIPGHYSDVIRQFYIIGDFWISESELLFNGNDEQKLESYSKLALNFFLPYLTDKGLAEYAILMKS